MQLRYQSKFNLNKGKKNLSFETVFYVNLVGFFLKKIKVATVKNTLNVLIVKILSRQIKLLLSVVHLFEVCLFRAAKKFYQKDTKKLSKNCLHFKI